MSRRSGPAVLCALILWLAACAVAAAEARIVGLATATSVTDSGLIAHLLPAFREATGYDVRVAGEGRGRADALADAARTGAYTPIDRGTWISRGRGMSLDEMFSGDPVLENPYRSITVDPAKVAGVDIVAARRFADRMASDSGQRSIAAYRVDGHLSFLPGARAPDR